MTSGPRTQQSIRGGLSPPPISSPSACAPRFKNQTWSFFCSTYRPVTCCMLQRLGKGLGQNGSTRKTGAPCASTACLIARFCFASERATQNDARATTQQIPKLTPDAILRSFFAVTRLSSLWHETIRGLEGYAEAKKLPLAMFQKKRFLALSLAGSLNLVHVNLSRRGPLWRHGHKKTRQLWHEKPGLSPWA